MGEMRRKDRAMPEADARRLLEGGEYGVLSTVGEDGLPYGVPVSYVLIGESIYFHCALQGRKLEHLNYNPAASFCVVWETCPVYENNFTTRYESVIAEGAARCVRDEGEKRRVLLALCEKYLPEHMDKAEGAIAASFAATAVYAVDIKSVSGKRRT